MHMTTPTTGEAFDLAKNLRCHCIKIDAFCDSNVVMAVGGGNAIGWPQVGANANGAGFLAVRQVHFAGNRPLGHVE